MMFPSDLVLPPSYLRFTFALPPIFVRLRLFFSPFVVCLLIGQQLDNNWTTNGQQSNLNGS